MKRAMSLALKIECDHRLPEGDVKPATDSREAEVGLTRGGRRLEPVTLRARARGCETVTK